MLAKPLHLAFVDLTYVDPFVDQTCYVLEQMFGWPVEFGRPRAKTEQHATHDVTGLVPLYGSVRGAAGVSFPRRLATTIASRLLQREILGIGEETTDAVGELANTIVGRAAACLGASEIRIGLPKVTVGKLRPISFGEATNPLVVELDTQIDCLTLEIGLAPSAEHESGIFISPRLDCARARQMF